MEKEKNGKKHIRVAIPSKKKLPTQKRPLTDRYEPKALRRKMKACNTTAFDTTPSTITNMVDIDEPDPVKPPSQTDSDAEVEGTDIDNWTIVELDAYTLTDEELDRMFLECEKAKKEPMTFTPPSEIAKWTPVQRRAALSAYHGRFMDRWQDSPLWNAYNAAQTTKNGEEGKQNQRLLERVEHPKRYDLTEVLYAELQQDIGKHKRTQYCNTPKFRRVISNELKRVTDEEIFSIVVRGKVKMMLGRIEQNGSLGKLYCYMANHGIMPIMHYGVIDDGWAPTSLLTVLRMQEEYHEVFRVYETAQRNIITSNKAREGVSYVDKTLKGNVIKLRRRNKHATEQLKENLTMRQKIAAKLKSRINDYGARLVRRFIYYGMFRNGPTAKYPAEIPREEQPMILPPDLSSWDQKEGTVWEYYPGQPHLVPATRLTSNEQGQSVMQHQLPEGWESMMVEEQNIDLEYTQ